jgi:Ca-activated chloride channel family protein
MRVARWTRASVAAAAALVCGPPAFVAAQGPVFRADANLVVLQVTVTPPAGGPTLELAAGDFTVLEDGVSKDIAVFSRSREPIALSLLLDVSDSMSGYLGLAQTAAIEFTRRLAPSDYASVVAFNQQVHVLQPFTDCLPDVERAIAATTSGGTTALYNALYVALRSFDEMRPADGRILRHAVVVLSDGDDTSSLVEFDDVFNLARASNASIYTIRLGAPPHPALAMIMTKPSEGAFVLRQFAQATGGRAVFVERAKDLLPVYARVAEELSSQYTLAFVPSHRDGRWHDIAVRVNRAGHAARTRAGYLAGK